MSKSQSALSDSSTSLIEQSLAQKLNFIPLFTKEQVFEAEDNNNETWGVVRRLTMITLTCTSDELIDGLPALLGSNGDSFLELIEQITQYRDYLKEGAALADCAQARIMAAAQFTLKGEKT